jgi:uncharacterized membrane protein
MQKDKHVDIKTAMVVTRKDSGKLKLKHKRRVTVWKGAAGGAVLGAVIVGVAAPAVIGGAAIGALVGSSRSGQRKELKGFLEDKLGPEDSALAVLVSDADWTAVDERLKSYGGEELMVELTPEAEEEIEALSGQEEVADEVTDVVDVEEEDD